MRTRNIRSSNYIAYTIAFVVIVVAFMLLGGDQWTRGLMSSGTSLNIAGWNWETILISLGVGVLIGILLIRRR